MYQNGMNGIAPFSWNPQYPQNNQPFQNSYYQMPSYYQQTPQTKTNKTFQGRFVNTIDEVTPNDVPMDGNLYPFILNDGSRVYGKRWNSKGQIETVTYIPEPVEPPKENIETAVNSEAYEKMVMAFNTLNTRLENIEKLLAPLAGEPNKP